MRVVFSGKQLQLRDPLRQYAEDHLVRQLCRAYDHPASELRVELCAAPAKDGPAVECRLSLHMPGMKSVQVRAAAPQASAALDAAAPRLVRRAKEALDRRREARHG